MPLGKLTDWLCMEAALRCPGRAANVVLRVHDGHLVASSHKYDEAVKGRSPLFVDVTLPDGWAALPLERIVRGYVYPAVAEALGLD